MSSVLLVLLTLKPTVIIGLTVKHSKFWKIVNCLLDYVDCFLDNSGFRGHFFARPTVIALEVE